jgi:hypothetical protein
MTSCLFHQFRNEAGAEVSVAPSLKIGKNILTNIMKLLKKLSEIYGEILTTGWGGQKYFAPCCILACYGTVLHQHLLEQLFLSKVYLPSFFELEL